MNKKNLFDQGANNIRILAASMVEKAKSASGRSNGRRRFYPCALQ
jgi:hypothetical protein